MKKSKLIELRDRIVKSHGKQFENEIQYFIKTMKSDFKIQMIFKKLENEISIEEKLDHFIDGEKILKRNIDDLNFESLSEQGLLLYNLFIKIGESVTPIKNIVWSYAKGKELLSKERDFVSRYCDPLFNCISDNLNSDNQILYLLTNYKKRTEWFTYKELLLKYSKVDNKQYEQIFEDDLRLFLFDNGIENPFSTPLNKSGRADIIGQLESEDPLIAEVKIIHKERKYGKERILNGFNQVETYASEYNKQNGYLIIFNLDNKKIQFNLDDNHSEIPTLQYNNRTYYFVIIGLGEKTASNLGKLKPMEINIDELINKNH